MLIDWFKDFFRHGFKRKKRYCDWHHKKETFVEGGDNFCCFECGHVFSSEENLLNEYNTKLSGIGVPRKSNVQDITFCPFCYHDF